MSFEHAMVDLETFGLKPESVILSIGIVPFSFTHGVGPGIEVVLNLEQQTGRHIDASTVAWWMQQSEEARQVITSPRVMIDIGLGVISDFINSWTVGEEKIQLWGNGSDFDNVLLANFWDWATVQSKTTARKPWSGKNNRCFRTLKNLKPSFKVIMDNTSRVIYHSAQDDARWQAECAVKMLREIG